jgi:hypothetical protein
VTQLHGGPRNGPSAYPATLLRLTAIVSLAVLCCSASFAQITNVTADQAPPTPGVGHDYIHFLNENVNPASGSVSIRIAVPVPPSREIAIPFGFGYDSNSAYHKNAPATYADNAGYLGKGGWNYVVPQLNRSIHAIQWTPPNGGLPGPATCNEPATAAEMESFRHTCPIDLPKDYLGFIEYSNGATGSFPNGNHIILWRIERLAERNRAYEVEDYAPGIFVFGSSGGGEAYGFDTRSSMAVIQIPFVRLQLSEVEYLVPSFTEFLMALAGAVPNGW